jgi:hypothetical protein
VQPSVTLLGDDLGEADGVGSLHLYNKGEERPISFYASCSDIRRTSYDVVTVGDSAHGGVESRATEARGDDDGCAVATAYGIEQLLHKDSEHLLCRTRRRIVDGEALSGSAGGKFLNSEMLHILIYYLLFTIYYLFTIEQFCDLQVSNIVIPSIVRDLAKCSGELRMTRCGERVIDISHREIFRYAQNDIRHIIKGPAGRDAPY